MGELTTLAQILTVGLCAAMVGVSKSGLPGLGILVVPLMATVMPARLSTGFLLPMLVMGDVFAVIHYRRHAVWKHLLRLLPWAVAGIAAGCVALDLVNDRQLRPIIGGVILLLLALHQFRTARNGSGDGRLPHSYAFGAAMGFACGVTTMMANAAGPIATLYLLGMRLPKTEFIGTGAWFFLIVNTFKVPFSARLGLVTRDTLLANLCFLPLILAGGYLGLHLAKRIPDKLFNRLVQILAAAAAVNLLLGGLRHPT